MTTLHTASGRLPGTVVDGDPHLTYYDGQALLSFVWTGVLTDPIHVQHGGYGEPTIALINPEPRWTGAPLLPADLLAWFRGACQTWTARWDGTHDTDRTADGTGGTDGIEGIEGAVAPTGGRGGCPHRLADGPLICDNRRPHRPGHGCTYTSSTGSWVDDRHDDGGHA